MKRHLRYPGTEQGRRRGILVASQEGGRRGNDPRNLQSGREWKSHRRTRTSTLVGRRQTRNSTRTRSTTSKHRRRAPSRLLPLLLLPAIVPAAGFRQESNRVLSYVDEYPSCTGIIEFYSDGDCDMDNNNASCGWDGGDCCECTCIDSLSYICGEPTHGGYYCLDPDSGCQDSTSVPTATPESERYFAAPWCQGTSDFVGDGFCDLENNSQACDYDGGDCCSCTCRVGPRFSCNGPFDCQDPDATCPTARAVEYLWVAWVILLLGIAVVLCVAYSCCDCCFCTCERAAEGPVVVPGGNYNENDAIREDNPENPLPPAQ